MAHDFFRCSAQKSVAIWTIADAKASPMSSLTGLQRFLDTTVGITD
jgi:hypothetical protein